MLGLNENLELVFMYTVTGSQVYDGIVYHFYKDATGRGWNKPDSLTHSRLQPVMRFASSRQFVGVGHG